MVKFLLIITMASQFGISYNGFGGVSVQSFDTRIGCEQAAKAIKYQLKGHRNLDSDDVKNHLPTS